MSKQTNKKCCPGKSIDRLVDSGLKARDCSARNCKTSANASKSSTVKNCSTKACSTRNSSSKSQSAKACSTKNCSTRNSASGSRRMTAKNHK